MALDGLLALIVERTLADVRGRQDRPSRRELEARGSERASRRHSLAGALRRQATEPIRFVAEIKKASPSRGVLAPNLDPARLASLYRTHGASALSVVTEPHFFQGSEGFLVPARAESGSLPILRKDFHVHELQILEAAAGDWDALLLIAGALSSIQLRDYLDMARAFRLEALVEVTDRREAEGALKAGAQVIGVNNRDLATFRVDPERTRKVAPVIAEAGVISVAESGIHDRETVVHYQDLGVHALLVGEALVTAPDPGERLRELRGVSPVGDGETSS